jgi:hypothetical protein
MYPKPTHKSKKQKRNGMPKDIIELVHQRSGRRCENESRGFRCGKSVTEYPHHLNERGLGGGRGLDIVLNLLDICEDCHNHDDVNFLHWCDYELDRRINEAFSYSQLFDIIFFGLDDISVITGLSRDEIDRQVLKGFLKTSPEGICHIDDIIRWLHGH